MHHAIVDLRAGVEPQVQIARVEYDHSTWAAQLDAEGVDEVFTASLRDGVWRCGLLSLPARERANHARGIQTASALGLTP